MKSRMYTIKRLSERNVQRSLQGASSRAQEGSLTLGIEAVDVAVPAWAEHFKNKDGSIFIELWHGSCQGGNIGGRVYSLREGKTVKIAPIALDTIKSITVAYIEKG